MTSTIEDKANPGSEILAEAKKVILDMLAGGQHTPTELRKEVGLATAPHLYSVVMRDLEAAKMVKWHPNLRLWSRG